MVTCFFYKNEKNFSLNIYLHDINSLFNSHTTFYVVVQPLDGIRTDERLAGKWGMLREEADASLRVFHGLQNFRIRRIALYLGQLHIRTVDIELHNYIKYFRTKMVKASPNNSCIFYFTFLYILRYFCTCHR